MRLSLLRPIAILPMVFGGLAGAVQAGAASPEPPGIDLAIAAKPAVAPARGVCKQVEGSVFDPDPAGRIVRAGPSVSTKELGRILPPTGEQFPAHFEIVETRNGWLKIRGAAFDPSLSETPGPPIYAGTGWISGLGVNVTLQSRLGFAAPSHQSPVLIDGRPSDRLFDESRPRRIIACDGRWILADWPDLPHPRDDAPAWAYRPEAVVEKDPLVLRAWVTGVCNIQETTCDGVDGTRPETSRLDGE